MEKLKSLAKTVKDVLEADARTRNSDSFLYLKVLEEYGNRKGLDINGMSVTTFLMRMT